MRCRNIGTTALLLAVSVFSIACGSSGSSTENDKEVLVTDATNVDDPADATDVIDPNDDNDLITIEDDPVTNPGTQVPSNAGNDPDSSSEVATQNDESANFEFVKEDVLGLTTTIDIGSVTTFLAGYGAERPDTFIMRKPVPNGCLYAFKAGDYCVAGATSAAELTFSRNGVSMTANACNLQNPDNLPVVEVPPRASAER